MHSIRTMVAVFVALSALMMRLATLVVVPALLTTLTSVAPAQDSGGDAITLANASQLRSVAEIDRRVGGVRRGPGDGELTLRLSNGSIQIVDDKHLRPIRSLDKRQSREYRVSPDQTLFAILERKFIRITNAKTGKVVQVKAGMDAHEFAFSPDSQLLAIGDSGSRPGDNEGAGFTDVRIVDARSGQLVHRMPRDESGWSALHPVFSPNGKILAIGSRNYSTRLYDVATGKLLHVLDKRMTHEIAFSPNGKVLAASYVDGTLALWSVEKGRMLRSTESGNAELYSVDWNPAGDLLVTSGCGPLRRRADGKIRLTKGSIRIWDPRNLTMVKELQGLAWGLRVRFTQDGKRIVGAGKTDSDKYQLNVWAIRPLEPVAKIAVEKDVEAAYVWAKKKLAASRSTQLPSLRGNPSLPLVRPLTSLVLFNVSVTNEELKHLAAFPKLKQMAISGKGITDDGLKNLSTLQELERLSLSGTSLSDAGMKHLAKLQNLKWLKLAGAKLTGAGIRELSGLPNLEDLSLIRSAIDDHALKEVGKLKELRKLNLRKTKVSDEGLKHLALMPELRELILQSTPITAEGLRHLAPCKSLREIWCWGTGVTSEEIRQLKEVMPNCEVDKTLIE